MLDLKVPTLSPSSSSINHLLIGAFSLYCGTTLATIFENQKTHYQFNPLASEWPSFNKDILFKKFSAASITSFLRGVFQLVGKIGGTIFFEDKFLGSFLGISNPPFSEGLFGTTVGTVLSYPFDTQRTLQISGGTFETKLTRKKSFFEYFKSQLSPNKIQKRFKKVYQSGTILALTYDVGSCLVANILKNSILSSAWFKPILFAISKDFTSHKRIAWFFGQSAARSLLTPMEYKKKQQQITKRTITPSSLLNEKWNFKGWYFAIPETFSEVIVTHIVFTSLALVFKGF